MAYYQITNKGEVTFTAVSLPGISLLPSESTIINVDRLPADLDAVIRAETLEVIKLLIGSVGSGTEDGVTVVTSVTTAALTSSQEISPYAYDVLPAGRHVVNNTDGDIAVRCSTSAASFTIGEYDLIIEPNEEAYVVADYQGQLQAICEVASGTITVKVFS